MTERPERSTKKTSRLGLYFMPAVFVVVAIAVSIGWMVATRYADAAFDHWLANETLAGRQWNCATRNMAGFPFRIELSCDGLTLSTSKGDIRSLSVGGFLAVAQFYQPSQMLVETRGPFTATLVNGQTINGQWAMMRSSLHFETPNRADRVDWVVDGLVTESSFLPVSGKVGHAEFHMRTLPNADGGPADAEFVASLADAFLKNIETPVAFDGHILVKKAAIFLETPGQFGVETWRGAGGEVNLQQWDIKRGEQSLSLTGTLSIDDTHHLAGKLDVAAKNIGDALKDTSLGAMGGILGSGSVKLPLTLAKGRVLVGPLKLAEFPPLY